MKIHISFEFQKKKSDLKIHISFVQRKKSDLYLLKYRSILRFQGKKIKSENTDPFCLEKKKTRSEKTNKF